MKKLLYTCLFTFGVFTLINCKNESTQVNSTNINDSIERNDSVIDSLNAKNSIDYLGTYQGVIPCSSNDCEEVELNIQLKENDIFIYSTKRIGIDHEFLNTAGNYHFENDGNTIVLDQIADAPNAFYITNGKIYQLDKNQNKVDGPNAEKYCLFKK